MPHGVRDDHEGARALERRLSHLVEQLVIQGRQALAEHQRVGILLERAGEEQAAALAVGQVPRPAAS